MLKGHFVTLRPMLMEDIPMLCNWFINNELAINFIGSGLASVEQIKDFFIDALKNPVNRKDFIIVEREKGIDIGAISIENINWRHRNSSMVILLGQQGLRERKFAAEANIICYDYAFDYLNLNRVETKVFSVNKPMLKSLEHWIAHCVRKCGPDARQVYRHEGTNVDAAFVLGDYCDVEIYAVLRQNYIKVRKQMHLAVKVYD